MITLERIDLPFGGMGAVTREHTDLAYAESDLIQRRWGRSDAFWQHCRMLQKDTAHVQYVLREGDDIVAISVQAGSTDCMLGEVWTTLHHFVFPGHRGSISVQRVIRRCMMTEARVRGFKYLAVPSAVRGNHHTHLYVEVK